MFEFYLSSNPGPVENTQSSWRATSLQHLPVRLYQHVYKHCQRDLEGVYLLLGYLPFMSCSCGHVVVLQSPGHWAKWKHALTSNCHCLSLTSPQLSGDGVGKGSSLLQTTEDCSAVCFLPPPSHYTALSYKAEEKKFLFKGHSIEHPGQQMILSMYYYLKFDYLIPKFYNFLSFMQWNSEWLQSVGLKLHTVAQSHVQKWLFLTLRMLRRRGAVQVHQNEICHRAPLIVEGKTEDSWWVCEVLERSKLNNVEQGVLQKLSCLGFCLSNAYRRPYLIGKDCWGCME